ncbi:hypothetical protein [Merismopedia glauca]|nr:hypothetical protein [Merismopedia glauca]
MANWWHLVEKFHHQKAIALYAPQGIAISLTVSYLLATGTSVLAKPASYPAIFQDVTLSPNFAPDPQTVRGIGGGSVLMKTISQTDTTPTGACIGFVDKYPDHEVVLNSFFNYLKIEVQSLEDTTILIKGPGGTWCNDDYQGKNPGVAGQWLQGNYQIWVGSYKQEEYYPYVIRFTEKP